VDSARLPQPELLPRGLASDDDDPRSLLSTSQPLSHLCPDATRSRDAIQRFARHRASGRVSVKAEVVPTTMQMIDSKTRWTPSNPTSTIAATLK
jgi:hypothetical protein